MTQIGSIGYAVRVSEQGKGYGSEILRLGLRLAKEHGMEKVRLPMGHPAENAQPVSCVFRYHCRDLNNLKQKHHRPAFTAIEKRREGSALRVHICQCIFSVQIWLQGLQAVPGCRLYLPQSGRYLGHSWLHFLLCRR